MKWKKPAKSYICTTLSYPGQQQQSYFSSDSHQCQLHILYTYKLLLIKTPKQHNNSEFYNIYAYKPYNAKLYRLS